jgi:hypothetical protein
MRESNNVAQSKGRGIGEQTYAEALKGTFLKGSVIVNVHIVCMCGLVFHEWNEKDWLEFCSKLISSFGCSFGDFGDYFMRGNAFGVGKKPGSDNGFGRFNR